MKIVSEEGLKRKSPVHLARKSGRNRQVFIRGCHYIELFSSFPAKIEVNVKCGIKGLLCLNWNVCVQIIQSNNLVSTQMQDRRLFDVLD